MAGINYAVERLTDEIGSYWTDAEVVNALGNLSLAGRIFSRVQVDRVLTDSKWQPH